MNLEERKHEGVATQSTVIGTHKVVLRFRNHYPG